jgi:hypothetical protein
MIRHPKIMQEVRYTRQDYECPVKMRIRKRNLPTRFCKYVSEPKSWKKLRRTQYKELKNESIDCSTTFGTR